MRTISIHGLLWLAFLLAAPLAPDTSQDPASIIHEFFSVLNSDDPAAMSSFAERGFSEGFRSRRSEEDNTAFYQRLRTDLGKVSVERLEITGPTTAVVTAAAERLPMPVRFSFDLAAGQIDAISVRIGGPPQGRAVLPDLPDPRDAQAFSAALDEHLRGKAAAGQFSGVVLLASDGEPFFHHAYGLADRAAARPVSTATRFDVGSITKLLTRIAIGQLAQEGKLDLDDPMLKHLPNYPMPDLVEGVTVQRLLDHTSGLGDIFNQRWLEADRTKFVKPTDFFPLFSDEPLAFAPGSRRSYSNAGFIVLGAIVEAASGMTYADYVEAKILAPAGMTRSSFFVRDGSDPATAIGYTRGGPTGGHTGAGGEERANFGMLPIRGCPAGSSTHTALDLLKLDRALRSGTLLDPTWTAWLFNSNRILADASYPLGVAGGGPGVSAGLESNGRVTAIVLTNLDPPAGDALAVTLFSTLGKLQSD